MNIALLAHDNKRELMIQFCIAYCGILSKHRLCSTEMTAKLVSDATGLGIEKYLNGPQGGVQQISARVACKEVDMLLFFRDAFLQPNEVNDIDLIRVCDVHNTPLATNIATAELMIHSLARGDLDWRQNL